MSSNRAASLQSAKQNPLKVVDAELPKAGKEEVVIKNHAIAINPVDCMSITLPFLQPLE
jgi:NADPH:quinone reductase-like Zn-dependent oxidoreductase